MNLLKTTFFSSIYTVIRVLSGVISVKFVAIYLGPAGVAFVGQFQSLLIMVNNFANLGITNGITKYIAEFKEDHEQLRKILSTSFVITLVTSSIIGVLIAIFTPILGQYLFKTDEYNFVLYTLAVAVTFYNLNLLLTAALNGFKQIKKLITARIIATIIGLGITVSLVVLWEVKGALLALVIVQCVTFFVVIIFSRKTGWFKKSFFQLKSDKKTFKKLMNFSLMAFSSVIVLQLRQMYLRDYVITNLSPEEAGYWQAIWKISELYLMVVTTSLSIYYLPKLSEIKDNAKLRKEIFNGYKILLPIVLVLSTTIFFTRDLIIQILFTNEFSAVRELFLFQLIGDVLKIASWILSFLLVAKAMTKEFIITEIIFKLSFFGFAMLFINTSGLIGLTYAFALNYFIYLITIIFIFRKLVFLKKT